MKVVIISDWFAEKMGYAENLLPKAMAKHKDVDVHVVTTDLQPAFHNYKEVYEPFIGPRQQPIGSKKIYNYNLHRLPHGVELKGRGIYIKGLYGLLKKIKPDIVQCFSLHWIGTYQAGMYKSTLGYKLFLEDHTHLSVFLSPKNGWDDFKMILKYKMLGKWLGRISELCYPIAPDVKDIVIEHFGYPASKTKIVPLGVDTDTFNPQITAQTQQTRNELRLKLGLDEQDIVCVYSGRLSPDKKPLLLAQAIGILQKRDKRFKALFIGSGTDEYKNDILSYPGCLIHPFVQWNELATFYKASDIGVWPSQESTSQIDAAACGLPLVLSNKIHVKERVNGNGFLYEEENYDDLSTKIYQLSDPSIRKTMGMVGAETVEKNFSWNTIVTDRLNDYKMALGAKRKRREGEKEITA